MDGEEYVGRKFRTVFLERDLRLDESTLKEFLRVSRALASEDMAEANAGNISVRESEGMLIKAGGRSFKELMREDIVKVVDYDEKTNTAKVCGRVEPSSETPMHWMIYQEFPEVNAVVHAHDQLVLKKQGLAGELGITITKKKVSYGTLEQAREVVEALRKSDYVLIRDHGSVSVGRNLGEALDELMKVHRRFEDEGEV
ncbi:MAG: class II aldolase/adducin family protein [Candidatus Altiarchaeota archaeon]|nr:class II aldolase/adducin family protein [Candidatus Altiarchaeota archaeon]